jgi:hypothetical protein
LVFGHLVFGHLVFGHFALAPGWHLAEGAEGVCTLGRGAGPLVPAVQFGRTRHFRRRLQRRVWPEKRITVFDEDLE